jgi:hypothetical protein
MRKNRRSASLSRRTLLQGIGMFAVASAPMVAAHGQMQTSRSGGMYFVPGGRIGIKQPDEIKVVSNSWTLLSADHTLMVDVRETIRLGTDEDAYFWDMDEFDSTKQTQRVEPGLSLPSSEVRRFRDLGYGADLDYMAETLVVRDTIWMGEVKVTTGDHGGLTKYPGGHVARWSPLMEAVFASIQVRAQLPVTDALAELGISLDTSGLNPRLIGPRLLLSLYTPTSALESWASNRPHISLDNVSSFMPPASPEEDEKFNDEIFAITRATPGAKVIQGRHCRGVQQSETSLDGVPDLFFTRITAFSKTRQQVLEASYNAAQREPILRALNDAFQSLKLAERS